MRNYISVLLGVLLLTSCGGSKEGKIKKVSELNEPAQYVCSMKCEGSTSDHAGFCPVCKMSLVKSIEIGEDENKEASPYSVYEMDYDWSDQQEEKKQLIDYKGKYQLVSMIFTNCEYACPNLIGDMQNLEDALNDGNRDLVNFLLVSIDPQRDTPARLKSYAQDMGIDNERWSLLNGNQKAVSELSDRLGVSYKKFENGAFGHSNVISLLNSNGEIIYQLEGIHADKTELVKLLNEI